MRQKIFTCMFALCVSVSTYAAKTEGTVTKYDYGVGKMSSGKSALFLSKTVLNFDENKIALTFAFFPTTGEPNEHSYVTTVHGNEGRQTDLDGKITAEVKYSGPKFSPLEWAFETSLVKYEDGSTQTAATITKENGEAVAHNELFDKDGNLRFTVEADSHRIDEDLYNVLHSKLFPDKK